MSHLISDQDPFKQALSSLPTVDLRTVFDFPVIFDEGGEGEGGDGGEGDGEGEGSEGSEGSGTDSSGEGSDTDDEDIKDPDKKKLHDENAKQRNRAKKAEEDLAEAQKKLREYEDKEKTDLQKAERDRDEATTKVEGLETENKKLRVKLGLYESGALDGFKDASDADLYLKVDEFLSDDGSVDKKKLSAALKALKDERPYLFESEDDDGDGDGQPSGSKPKGKKNRGAANDEALRKKFPALQGR